MIQCICNKSLNKPREQIYHKQQNHSNMFVTRNKLMFPGRTALNTLHAGFRDESNKLWIDASQDT